MIFIIRTRLNPLKSRPHPLLMATSIAVVAIGALLPFTPVGQYFGFAPLPLEFFLILSAMVASYLLIVEWVKRRFYRWYGRSHESAGYR